MAASSTTAVTPPSPATTPEVASAAGVVGVPPVVSAKEPHLCAFPQLIKKVVVVEDLAPNSQSLHSACNLLRTELEQQARQRGSEHISLEGVRRSRSISSPSVRAVIPMLGVDMEWTTTTAMVEVPNPTDPGGEPPKLKKVQTATKVALLQLCSGDVCVLFRLCNHKSMWDATSPEEARKHFPAPILELLGEQSSVTALHMPASSPSSPSLSSKLPIVKVGVGIQGDQSKLEKDFGISMGPVMEAMCVAYHLLPSCKIPEGKSLKDLSRTVCGVKLTKDLTITLSNWADDSGPLSQVQIEYASDDARASYLICERMLAIGFEEAVFQQLEAAARKTEEEEIDVNVDPTMRAGAAAIAEQSFASFRSSVKGATGPVTHTNFYTCYCAPLFGLPPVDPTKKKVGKLTVEEKQQQRKAKVAAAAGRKKVEIKLPDSKCFTGRNKQYYDNIRILDPNGKLLCTADTRKAGWYVNKKGLAFVTKLKDGTEFPLPPVEDRLLPQQVAIDTVAAADDDSQEEQTTSFVGGGAASGSVGKPLQPKTIINPDTIAEIQLKFFPSDGRTVNDEYYLAEKKNLCVVCGNEDKLVRHFLVPIAYRKHLPMDRVYHNSYDIMLICTLCFPRVTVMVDHEREQLAKEYRFPLTLPEQQHYPNAPLEIIVKEVRREDEEEEEMGHSSRVEGGGGEGTQPQGVRGHSSSSCDSSRSSHNMEKKNNKREGEEYTGGGMLTQSSVTAASLKKKKECSSVLVCSGNADFTDSAIGRPVAAGSVTKEAAGIVLYRGMSHVPLEIVASHRHRISAIIRYAGVLKEIVSARLNPTQPSGGDDEGKGVDPVNEGEDEQEDGEKGDDANNTGELQTGEEAEGSCSGGKGRKMGANKWRFGQSGRHGFRRHNANSRKAIRVTKVPESRIQDMTDFLVRYAPNYHFGGQYSAETGIVGGSSLPDQPETYPQIIGEVAEKTDVAAAACKVEGSVATTSEVGWQGELRTVTGELLALSSAAPTASSEHQGGDEGESSSPGGAATTTPSSLAAREVVEFDRADPLSLAFLSFVADLRLVDCELKATAPIEISSTPAEDAREARESRERKEREMAADQEEGELHSKQICEGGQSSSEAQPPTATIAVELEPSAQHRSINYLLQQSHYSFVIQHVLERGRIKDALLRLQEKSYGNLTGGGCADAENPRAWKHSTKADDQAALEQPCLVAEVTEFVIRWRLLFISKMKPQFLPTAWDPLDGRSVVSFMTAQQDPLDPLSTGDGDAVSTGSRALVL